MELTKTFLADACASITNIMTRIKNFKKKRKSSSKCYGWFMMNTGDLWLYYHRLWVNHDTINTWIRWNDSLMTCLNLELVLMSLELILMVILWTMDWHYCSFINVCWCPYISQIFCTREISDISGVFHATCMVKWVPPYEMPEKLVNVINRKMT